jgi:hypothetical protein
MKFRDDTAKLVVAPPPLRADIWTPARLWITLDRYLARKVIVIRPASHLGVAAPDHLTPFLAHVSDAFR